ncbi:PhoH family protein [Alteromonas sp. 14N.309.X.WAT.G.H12]|uniref:PhoH family protein n=1 Tax=Alteromonas sp. 14N.309.X.WAT.G.H12 TaxID=3120824 RepID=UPI002FD2E68F
MIENATPSQRETTLSVTPQKKRQYLLDTNVLVSDPHAVFSFDEHDVVVNMTVLEELDHLKETKRNDLVRKDARVAIQNLKRIIASAGVDSAGARKLHSGIPLPRMLQKIESGNLRVINEHSGEIKQVLRKETEDNWIISTALYLQEQDTDVDTILVTKDINMQLKAWAAGVKHVEDYLNDYQVKDIDHLASGVEFVSNDMMGELDAASPMEVVDSSDWACPMYITAYSSLPGWAKDVYINKVFVGEGDVNNGNVLRVIEVNKEADIIRFELVKLKSLMKRSVFGIKPRNTQQALAMDALLDPSISLVILTGPAGSGKTLLACAAAMDRENRYDRIILTRSATDMTEGIGFLPGTESEKMTPWLGGFFDALETLTAVSYDDNDSEETKRLAQSDCTMELILQRYNIQLKSMNYMRGRSINNRSIVLLDEAQNLTPSHMKAMLTRIGEGSKIVVMGNLSQIDAPFVNENSSALTLAVEVMKDYPGAAVFNLPGGERSELSAFVEENM